jgi:hypothetical protein
MMKEKTAYLKALEEAAKLTPVALKNGDTEKANKYFKTLTEAYERYVEATDYAKSMKSSNFSVLNKNFESVMPNLMVKNKKVLNEGVSLIKNDKNLLKQFKFINALRAYDGSVNPTEYVNESIALSLIGLDGKFAKESNKKFANFIVKNGIMADEINENEQKFLEDCDYLMLNKKKLSNLLEYNKRVASVAEYIKENAKVSPEGEFKPIKMIEGVDNKIANLNESERALVMDIISARNGFAEERRRNFYEKMKSECLKKVEKLISENEGEELERLKGLKESIENQKYCKESIVKDIAKLLEIGSILS